MSKKSKRESSIKSSILVLLLILILLIASTYAWFTANKTVTVSSLDVNVAGKNGLQISTNGTDWKSILSVEDITTNAYVGNANQLPAVLEPVSTIGEVADGKMKMFYGQVNPNSGTGVYELTATGPETEAAGAKGKFIAFDMFLKVNSDTQLILGTSSSVKPSTAKSSADKGLQNAARVAFLVEGHAADGSEPNTFTGLNGATSFGGVGSTTFIWEPNADTHTDPAKQHAKTSYKMTDPLKTPVDYYGIKAPISSPMSLDKTGGPGVNAGEVLAQVKPSYVTNKAIEATNIFTLQAGITKVRIYMWIEGQDIDCENSASGTDIEFNLQLEKPDEGAKG